MKSFAYFMKVAIFIAILFLVLNGIGSVFAGSLYDVPTVQDYIDQGVDRQLGFRTPGNRRSDEYRPQTTYINTDRGMIVCQTFCNQYTGCTTYCQGR